MNSMRRERGHAVRNENYVEGKRFGNNAEAKDEWNQRGIRRAASAADGTAVRLVVVWIGRRRLAVLMQRAYLSRCHARAAVIVFNRALRRRRATVDERRHRKHPRLKYKPDDAYRRDMTTNRGHGAGTECNPSLH